MGINPPWIGLKTRESFESLDAFPLLIVLRIVRVTLLLFLFRIMVGECEN